MSACVPFPALGLIPRTGSHKPRSLKGSEKFGLGFLLLSLVASIATRGAVGTEPLTAAIVCGFFLLPLEYVAVNVALAPLLPSALGELPHWYVSQGRWFLVFGGAAVIWFRVRRSSRPFRDSSGSVFRVLFLVFANRRGNYHPYVAFAVALGRQVAAPSSRAYHFFGLFSMARPGQGRVGGHCLGPRVAARPCTDSAWQRGVAVLRPGRYYGRSRVSRPFR